MFLFYAFERQRKQELESKIENEKQTRTEGDVPRSSSFPKWLQLSSWARAGCRSNTLGGQEFTFLHHVQCFLNTTETSLSKSGRTGTGIGIEVRDNTVPQSMA